MSEVDDRARDLRERFDRSFAEPPREGLDRDAGEPALAIRAGGDRYVRLCAPHVTALARCPPIVPLPGASPMQLGLAGMRGDLTVVFSLPRLLGYGADLEPAWVVRVGGPQGVTLAFDALDGQIRVPRTRMDPGPGGRRHVDGLVRTTASQVPIALVDLESILHRLEART